LNQVPEWSEKITKAVETVVYGKKDVIEKILVAILCRGHVLIEDVPGVAKTIIARTIAKCLGGDFKQIQCTPDLLPSDVLGVSIFNPKSGEFNFKQGPVVTNVLLVDEINRATPRTQSALLEAMAEGQVSVEGKSIVLPDPFFLIATQSPMESEGTFPLPEVQKDRFFLSLSIGYPDRDSESTVMLNQREVVRPLDRVEPVTDIETTRAMQQAILQVHVDEGIKDYILAIIHDTRADERLILGVSPRGSLALYKGSQALAALRGRDYVVPEDVKDIAFPVLAKRVLIKSEFSAKGLREIDVISSILGKIEVPGYKDAV
jgi:MoxR-like ATPase